jgi:UV DNA damage endonuclease
MSENKSIQLGLCCLNTTLRCQKPPIFSSRSIILRTLENKGIEFLQKKIIDNLNDTLKLIEWNEKNGIKVFRLSSELFPHKSNPRAEEYSFDFAIEYLKLIGAKSKEYKQRLTFHPGQYNVLGTPNIEYLNNTIKDLSYHATVLDLMELDKNSVIVIHGGGTYKNKELTKERWCKQFLELDDYIKSRIVLENCEKNFSIIDCLDISNKINIPVVFDSHHFECYKLLHPKEELKPPEFYMPYILDTWIKRDIKPKFHISEQGAGKCGHHSDFIETIPDYLLEIPKKYNIDIDIMIEAKMKEQAIFKLYNKYPELNCKKETKPEKINIQVHWSKLCKEECLCCN